MFNVYSDKKELKNLGNNKEIKNQKLTRWLLTLSGFDIKIEYRPEKKNQNADSLSRMNCLWNLIDRWAETPRIEI